jgi:hypothetical protein
VFATIRFHGSSGVDCLRDSGNRQNVYKQRLYQRLIGQVKKKICVGQGKIMVWRSFTHTVTGVLIRLLGAPCHRNRIIIAVQIDK